MVFCLLEIEVGVLKVLGGCLIGKDFDWKEVG